MHFESGRPEEARRVLGRILEAQTALYGGGDLDTYERNPSWVLDHDLARLVVFRRQLQREGVEPPPMIHVRLLIAHALLEEEDFAAAARDFAHVDDLVRRFDEWRVERADDSLDFDEDEALELLSEQEDSADGEDEAGEDEDGEVEDMADEEEEEPEDEEEDLEDDQIEGGDEDAMDEGEEDEEEEDEDSGTDFIDRARFYLSYGAALHFLGQQTRNRPHLERAQSLYQRAYDFLGRSEDAGELTEELDANMEEVKGDLRGFS